MMREIQVTLFILLTFAVLVTGLAYGFVAAVVAASWACVIPWAVRIQLIVHDRGRK